jgi:hypothetical protein
MPNGKIRKTQTFTGRAHRETPNGVSPGALKLVTSQLSRSTPHTPPVTSDVSLHGRLL